MVKIKTVVIILKILANLEFALWRLVAGLINYECKEAYRLAFCKVDKFHFAD